MKRMRIHKNFNIILLMITLKRLRLSLKIINVQSVYSYCQEKCLKKLLGNLEYRYMCKIIKIMLAIYLKNHER